MKKNQSASSGAPVNEPYDDIDDFIFLNDDSAAAEEQDKIQKANRAENRYNAAEQNEPIDYIISDPQPDEAEIADVMPKRRRPVVSILVVLLSIFGLFFSIILLIGLLLSLSALSNPVSSATNSLGASIAFGLFLAVLLTISIITPIITFGKRTHSRKEVTKKYLKFFGVAAGVILVITTICYFAGNPSKVYSYEGAKFTYSVNKGSGCTGRSIEITGLKSGSDVPERLVIPSKIRDVPVRSIKEGAFKDLTGVKEVVVPDSVDDIHDYAFSGCTALEKVTLPQRMDSIGKYAFADCRSLRQINKPGKSIRFFDSTPLSIDRTAFRGCTQAPEWTREYSH